MFRTLIVTSCFLCIAVLPRIAVSQSAVTAFDFVPVVNNGEKDVLKPEQVQVDEEKKVITAATPQDAINAAVDENLNEIKANKSSVKNAGEKNETPDVGTHTIDANGYLGFVATGAAVYDVVENPILTRISKRQAYVKAFQMAKKNLARELNGLSNDGKNRVRESIASINTELDNFNNLKEESETTIRQSLDAMLRGFVIYEVFDNDKENMIYVSIVTTPKTRGQLARPAPNRIKAKTLADGITQVVDEVRHGLCWPVGGQIIDVQSTGETAFVGFGSTVVRSDKESAIQQRLNLNALKVADAHAIDSLCGLIIGDRMSWEIGVRESLTKEVQRFEDIVKDDPLEASPEEFRVLDEERRKHVAKSETTEVYQSARRGKLPPGVQVKTWFDDDNNWAYGMAVYIPSATNAAAKAAREMSEAQILQGINDGSGAKGKGKGKGKQGVPGSSKDNPNVKRPNDKVKKGVTGKAGKKDF